MKDWAIVFSGSFSQALALRASLEARGIPTFMPDEMMKVVDPFITGASPFAVELRVPADALAEAQEIVAFIPRPRRTEPGGAEGEARRIEGLSQTVRWCLMFPLLGWIIGAFLGFRYMAAVRRQPAPPSRHTLTIVAWALEILLFVAFIAARMPS